ncbi:MAG TPA: squalene synthase HpnC [Novimethylophilus sp.]|jgi:squalene synthase HpnC|uniref:squalene synthase HpnC n=1 Tax=Novimethylophilus sp. TaxID=2137426 RepID=UPI002F41D40B
MHQAVDDSLKLANAHYENFPVASVLLPMRLRRPIGLIYAFARNADDFADEGELLPEQRLALLDGYRRQLDRIGAGKTPDDPLFIALAGIIQQYGLPLQLFHDLLDAFSQDVVKTRYENLGEVMDYCRRSANPVGRLLLHLYGETDERNLAYSDAICSALQIINFLQDVAIDYRKNRIYLPQDDLRKFHIAEQQIAAGDPGGAWWPLMQFEIERTRRLLQAGAPLGLALKGRIGLEMRSIIAGGETILRKLHRSHGDMFNHRPVLRPWDWAYMMYRAVRAK